jgi:hypothetical protein
VTLDSTWAGPHVLRLYTADVDSGVRTEDIGVSDLSGPLGTTSLSNFGHGRWVEVPFTAGGTGDVVTVTVTNTNGASNALLEGVFID